MIDLQPFLEEGFLRYALLGLIMLAPMCAAMGVQVVNLRMAFFSDAVSHSAFAGVALGLLAAIDVQVAMGALALLIGLLITAVARRGKLSTDTVIGVFFSAVVAFGLTVVYRHRHLAGQVQMLIYGNILTIGPRELFCQAALLVVLTAFQIVGFNRLLYIALNPTLASANRVPTRAYQYLFAGLLSLVVVFSVQAVGVFLVTAMLIVPAATARNLARSAAGMFWWAQLVALSSALAGLVISAQPWGDTPPGATIILVASAWFLLSGVVAALRPR
jgi:zinc transport system permease protein